MKEKIIPTHRAKQSEIVIEIIQQCLENEFENSPEKAKKANKLIKKLKKEFKDLEDNVEELKKSLEDEIKKLPHGVKDLKMLLEKEYEKKEIIEDKSKSLLTIASLLGVALAFLFKLPERVSRIGFLLILGVFIFWTSLYLISALKSVLYILCELNLIYEPSSEQTEELRKGILLNRYQNIKRTDYLSSIYTSIKRFFYWLVCTFIIYFLSLIIS